METAMNVVKRPQMRPGRKPETPRGATGYHHITEPGADLADVAGSKHAQMNGCCVPERFYRAGPGVRAKGERKRGERERERERERPHVCCVCCIPDMFIASVVPAALSSVPLTDSDS